MKKTLITIILISIAALCFYINQDKKNENIIEEVKQNNEVNYFIPLSKNNNKISFSQQEFFIDSKVKHFHLNENGLPFFYKDYEDRYEMINQEENKEVFFNLSAIFVTDLKIEDDKRKQIAMLNKMLVEMTDNALELYDLFIHSAEKKLIKRLDKELMESKENREKSNKILTWASMYLISEKHKRKDYIISRLGSDYHQFINQSKNNDSNSLNEGLFLFYIDEELNYYSEISNNKTENFKIYTKQKNTIDYMYKEIKKAMKREMEYEIRS